MSTRVHLVHSLCTVHRIRSNVSCALLTIWCALFKPKTVFECTSEFLFVKCALLLPVIIEILFFITCKFVNNLNLKYHYQAWGPGPMPRQESDPKCIPENHMEQLRVSKIQSKSSLKFDKTSDQALLIYNVGLHRDSWSGWCLAKERS